MKERDCKELKMAAERRSTVTVIAVPNALHHRIRVASALADVRIADYVTKILDSRVPKLGKQRRAA